MKYPNIDKIRSLIEQANHIVVLQADNPDADSLGSSLALEHLLGDSGKQVSLYCASDIPTYLRYLPGWDRVSKDLPHQFDGSIFVDASTLTLFEKLQQSGQMGWLAAKPSLVLDHHASVQNPISFATLTLCDEKASSTCELVYHMASELGWLFTPEIGAFIMSGILGDTQGLTNDLATGETYKVMAALVEQGTNRPQLEERRREYTKMPLEIYKYKAQLIEHTEWDADGRIAHVTVPQVEINEFSPLYNPAPLIQNDMLSTSGVAVAIVFKHYDNGITTGSLRANLGYGIVDKVAEHLGGGGHAYASGFKVTNGRPLNEIKSECIKVTTKLLNNLTKERPDETVQHTY